MHEMTKAYLICALWSSTDNSNEQGGNPLDDNYGLEDLAEETIDTAERKCLAFLNEHSKLIGSRYEQAGHDFWLTRNGHGCGFWEVPDWPEADGKILTATAKKFGGINLYIGDDNKLYFE